MFVSYLVRSQFIVPYRLLCGVPVRPQSVNSPEIACSLYIENDLVTFADLRPGLVAVRRPHVLLCQNSPVAFDDGPNPVGRHVRQRGILLTGQKTLLCAVTWPPSSGRRAATRSSEQRTFGGAWTCSLTTVWRQNTPVRLKLPAS